MKSIQCPFFSYRGMERKKNMGSLGDIDCNLVPNYGALGENVISFGKSGFSHLGAPGMPTEFLTLKKDDHQSKILTGWKKKHGVAEWESTMIFLKKMGSLGDSSTVKWWSSLPYIHGISKMGVPPRVTWPNTPSHDLLFSPRSLSKQYHPIPCCRA